MSTTLSTTSSVPLRAAALACALSLAPLFHALGAGQTSAEPELCAGNPKVVGKCFSFAGRFEAPLATPLRLWMVGTNRMLSVAWGDEPLGPPVADLLGGAPPQRILVFGHFRACPLQPVQLGTDQPVCLEYGRNLNAVAWDGTRIKGKLWSSARLTPAQPTVAADAPGQAANESNER